MISTACGIISVGLLLYVAIRFPEYYCTYTDKNTLNNLVTTDIQVQTYETAYTSFAEKIHALAQARGSGIILNAVRMNETEVNPGRKEMTRIIRKEFKKMKETAIILTAFKPKAKNMITCERYTIFAANEHDSLKGISCWKVEYESKKRTITLYLDEEYHKIYYFHITQKITQVEESVDSSTNASLIASGSVDSYEWWSGMIRYYDLASYQGFMDGGVDYYDVKFRDGTMAGRIEYDDIMEPLIVYRSIGEEMDVEFLMMGLLMEKMIQF
ncbi:MAG: hypothetical protein K2J67_00800 [Lachnospiraceae bacterium]|nr:hypothetical protein [Lachnospiraceae bacterium]